MGKKGMALVSVLIIAAALMGVLAVGIALGDRGVLFVSQSHKRNVALGAAEAGVYEVVMRLEADKNFNGTATGTLAGTGATFNATVDNQIWTGGSATVTSTGTLSGTSRTLLVTLEPDTISFGAVGVRGKVYTYDRTFINGIASPSNPIYRPGSIHSEFNGNPSMVGDYFQGSGSVDMRATGSITTQGQIGSSLNPIADVVAEGLSKPQYRLSRSAMLSGGTPGTSIPGDGVLTQSTVVSGGQISQRVTVPKGMTLHVTSDVEFLRGITGDGNVVVDGNAYVKTTAQFDPAVKEGVKLRASGSVSVSHPEVSIDDDDGMDYEYDLVGDYFAQMPPDASSQIANNLPVTAPGGAAFFDWFDANVGSADPQFNLWYNGDGTQTKPGLTPATKAWLQGSRPIKGQIATWAAGQ